MWINSFWSWDNYNVGTLFLQAVPLQRMRARSLGWCGSSLSPSLQMAPSSLILKNGCCLNFSTRLIWESFKLNIYWGLCFLAAPARPSQVHILPLRRDGPEVFLTRAAALSAVSSNGTVIDYMMVGREWKVTQLNREQRGHIHEGPERD